MDQFVLLAVFVFALLMVVAGLSFVLVAFRALDRALDRLLALVSPAASDAVSRVRHPEVAQEVARGSRIPGVVDDPPLPPLFSEAHGRDLPE